MARVVVLGSLHLDYLVRVPYIARKGETLRGEDLREQCGGKGANQAYYAALQGTETHMVGRVGDDSMGAAQMAALAAAGVDTKHVTVDPEAKSGMSIAMIDADADYSAVIVSGANMRLSRGDVDAADDVIRGASCLVMQYEVPLDAVLHAARLARRHGVRVLVNAAPAYPSADILAETDILVVNEVEADMLLGIPPGGPEETLSRLRRVDGPAVVVVTLGASGLAYSSPEGDGFIPSHKVTVKDAHGAGDCFIGSFAARLALGDSMADALAYGNAAAAESVTHVGPRSLVLPGDVARRLAGVSS